MPSKKSSPRTAQTAGATKAGPVRAAAAGRSDADNDATVVRRERAQKYLKEERRRQAEMTAQGYCF